MTNKAYIVQNASIPVVIDGREFTFEPYEFMMATNSFWGVIDTNDPEVQATLEKSPRVHALDDNDREIVLQKKSSSPSKLNLIVSLEQPQLPFSREGGAAPAGKADPVAVIKTKVESQEEILATKLVKKGR